KTAKLYEKLDIFTSEDLLYHLPRSYIDISCPKPIAMTMPGEETALKIIITYKAPEQLIRGKLSLFKVEAIDDSGEITLTFFNTKYTVDHLKENQEYIIYGKISGNNFHREMNTPQIFPVDGKSGYIAIYPQTAGLSSKMISSHLSQLVSPVPLLDPLPPNVLCTNNLMGIDEALLNIHFPQSNEALMRAKQRLIFEELFILTLTMQLKGKKKVKQSSCKIIPVAMEPFINSLPFIPTNGQFTAIDEITEDLCGELAMNRLLQGDVGCGKTMVAAAAIYIVIKNNYQSAMMAPTELLAEQHYETLTEFLAPLGITIALLTGSVNKKDKQHIKEGLADGSINLCIGTHALISEDVSFKNLGLVITDEQHRFGVSQRTGLSDKGINPHTLVMSATPIPRTLALILYGDLNISTIKEMPQGRMRVKTYAITTDMRERAFSFIKKHLDQGFQAYIVCPLIETGDVDMGLIPVIDYARQLSENSFADYTLALLHGKMKSKEKETVMSSFKNGTTQLLVSTTVIEVGMDVPNAVIMLIEDAHRFGLSQLHQLRGRVGRGSVQSHCILVSDSTGDEARGRLKKLCSTNDGFELAQFDLAQRG
ncbi:MAG: ATP-dependent DNA helicase RecG, partial [Oscillospiraceae bacterium]